MVKLLHLHHELLLSNEKEETIDTHNLLDSKERIMIRESQKGFIPHGSIYVTLLKWENYRHGCWESGAKMKGVGSGCGCRRDPCGDGTVLHLTTTQKGMKEVCAKCLQQLLLVWRILEDFWQSTRGHSHKHVAGPGAQVSLQPWAQRNSYFHLLGWLKT